jgi:hypothetical protein
MRFGPVPLEIYEMAKGEPMWLPELDSDRYSWILEGRRLKLVENFEPDVSVLSDTDLECLREGFDNSRSLTFTERTAATHGSDWQKAELGLMNYEDMIEDFPEKPELVAYLQENARFMRL